MRLRRPSTPARQHRRARSARRSGALVGLDIGATSVRGVRLARSRDGYRIIRAASVPLPPGTIVHGEVANPRALEKALRRLWRRGRFGTRRVCFGVAAPGVITRQTDLPWMPEPDFGLALRYQVGDALPVELDSVELAYHPLGEYARTDQHGQVSEFSRVLLVAAHTAPVTALAHCLRKARLEPVSADSAAFALIRAACAGRLPEQSPLEAIVDVGHDAVTVILHEGGQPRFLRSVASIGSDAATTAMADRFSLDHEAAETLKVETGLNGPVPVITPVRESSIFGGLPLAPVEPADPRTQGAMSLASTWAGRVIGEIRNSVDYYASTHPEATLSRIVLTGRGALIDGFTSRVQTELRVPVTTLDLTEVARTPRRGVAADDPDSLVIAAGLAMAA